METRRRILFYLQRRVHPVCVHLPAVRLTVSLTPAASTASDLSVNRARAGLLRRELRFAKHGHASTVLLEDFAAHVARQLAKARL